MTRWMKHREKQGVWHVATKPLLEIEGITTYAPTWITACRGDMLFGSIGPIVQQFEGLPKSPKCVRCTQLFLESRGHDSTHGVEFKTGLES
jgi:hypothetical protein